MSISNEGYYMEKSCLIILAMPFMLLTACGGEAENPFDPRYEISKEDAYALYYVLKQNINGRDPLINAVGNISYSIMDHGVWIEPEDYIDASYTVPVNVIGISDTVYAGEAYATELDIDNLHGDSDHLPNDYQLNNRFTCEYSKAIYYMRSWIDSRSCDEVRFYQLPNEMYGGFIKWVYREDQKDYVYTYCKFDKYGLIYDYLYRNYEDGILRNETKQRNTWTITVK